MNTIPLLFQAFCDDAAMFPPGSLPAAEAVKAHQRACTAYGTCSIAEPLADLAALNLLGSATHPEES